jgi:hypothetical protein
MQYLGALVAQGFTKTGHLKFELKPPSAGLFIFVFLAILFGSMIAFLDIQGLKNFKVVHCLGNVLFTTLWLTQYDYICVTSFVFFVFFFSSIYSYVHECFARRYRFHSSLGTLSDFTYVASFEKKKTF